MTLKLSRIQAKWSRTRRLAATLSRDMVFTLFVQTAYSLDTCTEIELALSAENLLPSSHPPMSPFLVLC
jgi:hypothetical protein